MALIGDMFYALMCVFMYLFILYIYVYMICIYTSSIATERESEIIYCNSVYIHVVACMYIDFSNTHLRTHIYIIYIYRERERKRERESETDREREYIAALCIYM